MAYTDLVRSEGKQVRVGPNTKGTGTRGVPVAVAEMGKDRTVPAVEDPEKSKPTGSVRGLDGIRDVGRRKTISPDPSTRTANKVAPKS